MIFWMVSCVSHSPKSQCQGDPATLLTSKDWEQSNSKCFQTFNIRQLHRLGISCGNLKHGKAKADSNLGGNAFSDMRSALLNSITRTVWNLRRWVPDCQVYPIHKRSTNINTVLDPTFTRCFFRYLRHRPNLDDDSPIARSPSWNRQQPGANEGEPWYE